MSVSLYVEGGGDSKELKTRCREGFAKLIEKSGFDGRMPRIVACGSRYNAFDSFTIAASDPSALPMLLVDSEDLVVKAPPDHVRERDGWNCPTSARDDQVHLMVTCMETWLMADQATLGSFFGSCLRQGALFPSTQLEQRSGEDVRVRLEQATRACGQKRAYTKGKRSFQILAEINPQRLQVLPHFQRFVEALERHLPPGTAPGGANPRG